MQLLRRPLLLRAQAPENYACPDLSPKTFIVDWSVGGRTKYGYVKEGASSIIALPVWERLFSLG